MRLTMRRLLSLTLLSLGLPFSGLAAPGDDLARQGNELYHQERYDEAVAAYRQALEKAPDSARIQYNLGSALAQQGQYADAEQVLRQTATRLGSGVQRDAYYNLGVTVAKSADALGQGGGGGAGSSLHQQMAPQMEIARLEEALAAFREAMIVDPRDDAARYNYEVTLRRIEKLRQQAQQQQQDQSGRQQSDQRNQQQQSGEGDQSQDGQNNQDDTSQNDQGGQQQQEQQEQSQDQTPPDQPEPQQGEANDEQNDESQERQQEGLEGAAPTPQPTPPSERQAEQAGAAAGEERPRELTPEQMDAERLLNLLSEEQPEQFKRLFQFRGQTRPSRQGKDW
ncbi:MAG TPA: tetratricopeptide repeat protein [Candidatus Sumerlaeota bacterium]|nr:MAG: cellulose synthase subunit BcsC [candidate division BRC1 bacterium ADurb.BinA292]HOE97577.1 tetratricopeptide repeat protein [Candidatus Sumerlaeota bacterium]HOR27788.1 tetratricopeptide repeat protein [Candidatus Sumerlaeota bacterium]HPK00975.1 tetratricopeptide repeat protein [Candidatus Sumerlaeota bacterium]